MDGLVALTLSGVATWDFARLRAFGTIVTSLLTNSSAAHGDEKLILPMYAQVLYY